MSSKLRRRDAIKVMAAAGAVLIGAPFFVKSVTAAQLGGNGKTELAKGFQREGTLVIRVKGDEITGYTGTKNSRSPTLDLPRV